MIFYFSVLFRSPFCSPSSLMNSLSAMKNITPAIDAIEPYSPSRAVICGSAPAIPITLASRMADIILSWLGIAAMLISSPLLLFKISYMRIKYEVRGWGCRITPYPLFIPPQGNSLGLNGCKKK